MSDLIQQSAGFFDTPTSSDRSLLPLQVSVSSPNLPTLEQATGMISPDRATMSRLDHFDPDLYDLRPESHLVRFLKVLLGDAGVGQVRKRYTVARLSATMGGSHFYDLDGFYGSIFGAQRHAGEQLPIDPMVSTATPDVWDDIAVRDTLFRERITALAKSLPMAGTVEGLRQAAEALSGVECDIYETWRLLETGETAYRGRTWDEVEALFTDWDAVEGKTWDEVAHTVKIGQAGLSTPDEVYVRPKKDYTPADSSGEAFREAERQRLEDEMSLQRVLNVLKPSGVLLTVDNRGLAIHSAATIAALASDSDFWEVQTKVTPRPGLGSNPYPDQSGDLQALPRVPFTNSQQHQWSYNSTVTSVAAYAVHDTSSTITADGGSIFDQNDWEQVPDSSGHIVAEYRPAMGLTDQKALVAAQASADSMLQAHPYSGPRVKVETHG